MHLMIVKCNAKDVRANYRPHMLKNALCENYKEFAKPIRTQFPNKHSLMTFVRLE